MPLDLVDYETLAREAVKVFWGGRTSALTRNATGERADAGTRGAVTGGKHLDGFVDLMKTLVVANGMQASDVRTRGCTLPGYYRATKNWDLVIVHQGVLVAAIELKSQVGSFGNNFNNRTEEVLGSATDLWEAYREGAFTGGVIPGAGDPKPFIGWLMVLEGSAEVETAVKNGTVLFPVFPEFQGASYRRRYELLCERLMLKDLYEAAALLVTPRTAAESGNYEEIGLRNFVTGLAAHVARVAALTK